MKMILLRKILQLNMNNSLVVTAHCRRFISGGRDLVKRFVALFVVVVLVLFSGCNNTDSEFVDDAYLYSTDSQLVYSGAPAVTKNIAKGEDGYYSYVSKFLYYTDNSGKETVPLCFKPNCLHNTESCNAYIGTVYSIAYNEENLYYICDAGIDHEFIGLELYRMKYDGSEKEKVLYFDKGASSWIVHRGYLYYNYIEYYDFDFSDNTSSVEADVYIYRVNLSDLSGEPEMIYYAEDVYMDANISSICAFGNNVYFLVTGCAREDESVRIEKYMKLNTQTFEAEDMRLSDGRMLVYPTLLNNKLVFQSEKNENGEFEYYSTDFNGCMPELIITVSEDERVFCDGKFLYVDNKMKIINRVLDNDYSDLIRRFEIYDSDVNLLDEVYINSDVAYTWSFLPIDENVFLFAGKKDDGENIVYFYDKKQIGTINGEWKRKVVFCSDEGVDNTNKPGALSGVKPNGSTVLVDLWQKAKDEEYGVKDSFQADGAEVAGGFSVRLIWQQDEGMVTAYFPVLEFDDEEKATEYLKTNPYALKNGNIAVNIGVESVPQEVYSMLSSILAGEPIEPIDSSSFSGQTFSLD